MNIDLQRLWADAIWLPCRTKGVLAISCLIRNNPAGLNAFLASSGVSKLVSLLQEDNPRLQRQAPSVPFAPTRSWLLCQPTLLTDAKYNARPSGGAQCLFWPLHHCVVSSQRASVIGASWI